MQIVRMIETRELPEVVRELLEEIKTTKLYKMVKRAINSMIQEYPEEYEAIKFVVMKVIATLERDISIVREKIMEMPAIQKIIDWIIHHFHSVSPTFYLFLGLIICRKQYKSTVKLL